MLSSLRDLRHLDLSSNYLERFPVGIDNLTGLTLLDLSQNSLGPWYSASGTAGVPPNISACRNLRFLDLQDNYLSGEIPSLRGLVKLQILLLAGNQFSGPFPKELLELSGLVTLDLSQNQFNGSIPALANFTKLVHLKLGNNSFTEFELPWLLGSNLTLQQLSLSFNHLVGSIPPSMINLLNLQVLNLSGNRLTGDIPLGFSRQLEHTFSLDLSQNQLTGNIPADMLQQSDNSSCAYFNLSYNLLTGPIPSNESPVCIEILDLSQNNLSGPVSPNIFGGQLGITYLWLQNNQLSGDIVDVLLAQDFAIYLLLEARLQHNLFTGDLSRLSTILDQFDYLDVFDISNNDLRWSTSEVFPDPIRSVLERLSTGTSFTEFRVGGNNFSGTSLPTTCFVNQSSDLLQLRALDLSSSELNGEISSAAFYNSCFSTLQYLNLSNNNITGPLPESIVTIAALEILDVSNNNLSGPLPTILATNPVSSTLNTNPTYFDGNELCGYPLGACPVSTSGGGSRLPLWVLLITIGGSTTIALISCLAATWRWRVYRRMHQQDADLIKTFMERDSATLMPLRELKKATDNFADGAQIGQGGFGIVYIGKLNDGTTVAIKRSKREGTEKDKEQFLNEVRILSQVNHRNLVKLIGCCMENKIAVLVFEFVSNGTLEEHLRGKIGAPNHLTWKERLNIAVQTADALNYLHSAATFPIYHRDVKSANILLNDDLNAKVADFGISRLAPLQATHVSTVAVQGTMGYIDPEYYTSYQLTDKSDVYSFGVVLLELISARPALDFHRGGEETSLVYFAGPYIARADLEGFVDSTLLETYNDLAGHGRDSIQSVGRLAMRCVEMRSKVRPSMNEVLKELQSLWLALDSTSAHLNSITTDHGNGDARGDAQHDDIVLLFDSISSDSSMFSVGVGANSIQMSQLC